MENGGKYLALSLLKNMDTKNLSIIRQSFANTVFTHKVQEVAAENKERKITLIKWANVILVGAVLVMLVLQSAYPSNSIFTYIGSGIAIAEVLFLVIQLSFGFEQQMIMHKNSALKYMQLRDKYRALIADIMNGREPHEALLSRRDLLQAEYQVISDLSPQTSMIEYEEAQRRLNKAGVVESEQFTWSDAEIDRFLPEDLRLNQ